MIIILKLGIHMKKVSIVKFIRKIISIVSRNLYENDISKIHMRIISIVRYTIKISSVAGISYEKSLSSKNFI